MEISNKKFFVVRTKNEPHLFLTNSNSFVKASDEDVLWNVLSDALRDNKEKEDISYFKSADSAEKRLFKAIDKLSGCSRKKLPGFDFEVVEVKAECQRKTIESFSGKTAESDLYKILSEKMDRFEAYFVESSYAKKAGLTIEDLKKARSDNLMMYCDFDFEIHSFYENWLELNCEE